MGPGHLLKAILCGFLPLAGIHPAFSILSASLLDGEFGSRVQFEECCFLVSSASKVTISPN